MALITTSQIDYIGSFIGGLILAAPFGAVMATVSSYLVVIASGLVRDLYQRFIHPDGHAHGDPPADLFVMIVMGCIAFAANISPVAYLQAIVVFCGASGAATFVTPVPDDRLLAPRHGRRRDRRHARRRRHDDRPLLHRLRAARSDDRQRHQLSPLFPDGPGARSSGAC